MSDLENIKRYPVPYAGSKYGFGFQTHYGFGVKSGKIACLIEFPILKKGIMGLINDYGCLYYGTMPKNRFLNQHFKGKKYNFIQDLSNILIHYSDINVKLELKKKDMAFYLELCRELTTKTKWRWPALMNRCPDGSIIMSAGSSRGLATLLTTKHEPWKQLPVLFYERPNFNTNEVLENYIKIETDDDLHSVLGCSNDTDAWNPDSAPEVQLVLNFDGLRNRFSGIVWPTLDAANGGMHNTIEFGLGQSTIYLDNFLAWKQRYPDKQTLHVYTDWPELVIDTNQIWNIIHAGTSRPIIDDMNGFGGRVGRLENICRIMHNNPEYTKDFTLYVVKPIKIDTSNFLPWMDLDHTTYIEKDWDFLLYRKDRDYKNTFISCGFIE